MIQSTTSSRKNITLNIVPITFSEKTISVGRLEYKNEDDYTQLRETYKKTHAFRFDPRDGFIANVAIEPNTPPLGDVEIVEVQENLLLLGRAIQQSILNWLANQLPIIKADKRLTFWGGLADAMILSNVLKKLSLSPTSNLDVVTRYDLDTRMLWPTGEDPKPYLGLIIDISTANIIDIPLTQLLENGVDVIGKYVCTHEKNEQDYLRPHLKLVGQVSQILDDRILLNDTEGINEIDVAKAFLEPRSEYLDDIIQKIYGNHSKRILGKLKEYRGQLSSASAKLEKIIQTLNRLKTKHSIVLGSNVKAELGDILSLGNPLFPQVISTSRPNFLFGPQGRNSGTSPDLGIQNWGPFNYSYHARNTPVIAVICEAQYRGRVDQFVKLLRDGFLEDSWQKATSWQKNRPYNPYKGGLIGKFRLTRVDFQFEETSGPTAREYREAVDRLLARSPKGFDLAIVQIRDNFKQFRGNSNPYFVTKAAFMEAGIPVQSIKIENMEVSDYQLGYILNNIGLAIYAKLDGTPWVISSQGQVTHELIIGLGYSEITEGRLSEKIRYMGITTMFKGDGRYLLWGLTREVEYENYATALLENLRTAIQYVKEENNWQKGDSVRLIFHVYKHLKNVEINAIKQLVHNLTEDEFRMEYAFLDISEYHMYQIFDPAQKGKEYRSLYNLAIKGKGVPARGTCYQLSNRQGLLQLIGPSELKTSDQGIPRPLLVDLHPDSDFQDMTYLLRQVFYFTFMSWQNFFPASEPVTILYSRFIARMLGNLRSLPGWSSKVISVGSLRDRRWFL